MSNVPKLRFAGFEGEWEKKKLKDVGSSVIGLTYSPKDISDKGYLVLRASNVKDNQLAFDDQLFVNMRIPEKLIVHKEDILICARSGSQHLIGKNAYIDKDYPNYTFGAFMCVFRCDRSAFVFQGFQTSRIKKQILENQGARINQITTANINAFSMYFPGRNEQTKIADFLTLIDQKITKQDEKVAALEQYKKVLMQRIFTCEIRFKDDNGKDYPEWEVNKLINLLEIRDERQAPTSEAPLMAFTSTGGVEEKGDRYNRDFLVKDKNKKYKRTESNDLIYSSNNLDVGAIGRNKYGTAVISDVYEVFIAKENVIPGFLEMIIKQKVFLNKVLKYRQGALYGQYRIHADDFLSIEITVPSLPEQTKIAKFLGLYDHKMEKEKTKLEALREQKKGLLQQMFV